MARAHPPRIVPSKANGLADRSQQQSLASLRVGAQADVHRIPTTAESRKAATRRVYLGVDAETATVPSNPATAGGAPTVSRAYVMRIDLCAPGVSRRNDRHTAAR